MTIDNIFESIKSGDLTTKSIVGNFEFYTDIRKEDKSFSYIQYVKKGNSTIQISKYKINSLEKKGDSIIINIENEDGIKYETGYFFDNSGKLMILNSNKTKFMSERRCCLADVVDEDFAKEKIIVIDKETKNAYYNGKVLFHIDSEENPIEEYIS